MPKALRVTLVKSLIGLSPQQEATVKALGLRHIRQTVEHDDTPSIRGMIREVSFCLKVAGRGAAAGEPSGSAAGRGAAAGEPSGSRAGT